MSPKEKSQRWLKENVEAIAIAVVMALVIRHFAIEAFKIPTESMAPTLLGDRLGGGTGDRILVDKVGPMIFGLDRWDIFVFKYPLNTARNYIKRVVGFGGETLSIRDGDVWIDGEIARKPPGAQEVLYYPVYPADERLPPLRGSGSNPFRVEKEYWKRPSKDVFEVAIADGLSLARFDNDVKDAPTWEGERYGTDRVGDLRLRLTVVPESGQVVLRLVENKIANDLVLAVGSGESYLLHGEERIPLPDFVLEPGEETEIVFENVDDALHVTVDGDRVSHEYQGPDQIDHFDDQVRFGVRNGAARFSDLGLDRDVYYVRNGNCKSERIPEGHYFALGDNSRNSRDSRLWNLRVYEAPDGQVFKMDNSQQDSETRIQRGPEPFTMMFQDWEGVWRVVPESLLDDDYKTTEAAPFIPAKNVVGRAFFVFWPLNPLKGQFRLKFIR